MKDTPPPKPSLRLSWQDWMPYLQDSEASDAQKRQLIETLWFIMAAFVNYGWDLDKGTKKRSQNCGQVTDLTTVLRQAVLRSQCAPEKEGEEV